MKKIIATVALALLASGFLAHADDHSTATDSVSYEIRVDPPELPGNPHRMPSRSVIRCTYSGGNLSFVFPGSLLRVSLRHIESDFETLFIFPASNPVVQFTPAAGVYKIEAITEDDQRYSGEIIFVTEQ